MKKLVAAKRVSQAFFFFLFVYVLWSTTYPLKGLFSPKILFKIDPLIMIFTALSERVFLGGMVFAFMMIALTLVFGRFFCGWVCPLGTVIDAAGLLRRKKTIWADSQNRRLRNVKFFGLGIILICSILGIQAAWVFDPIVIMARVVSLNVIPAVTSGIDGFFVFIIKRFELYGPVYDFYRTLKESFLGVNIHFFANSLITFVIFLSIVLASLLLSRAWCRVLCPLGALYAVASRFSLLERIVGKCLTCGICQRNCRMGAIKADGRYVKGECILCMDCVYVCPENSTRFSFVRNKKDFSRSKKITSKGISRSEFLLLLFSLFPLAGFNNRGKKGLLKNTVIRPPGALREDQFVDTCVRCGNCMKVCITNGLQPCLLESGIEGIWTPQLVPEIGYCEYQCTLCGEVCPTGAIARLPVKEKMKTRLGIAEIDRSLCIAWAQNKECIVCEEHCPVADKAIKTEEKTVNGKRIFLPSVDQDLCVGCGICQNKCPVTPIRAIRVNPQGIQRTSLS